jgi:hypothetical protein
MSHSAQDIRTQEAPEAPKAMEEIETVDLTTSPITEEISSPQPTNIPMKQLECQCRGCLFFNNY